MEVINVSRSEATGQQLMDIWLESHLLAAQATMLIVCSFQYSFLLDSLASKFQELK